MLFAGQNNIFGSLSPFLKLSKFDSVSHLATISSAELGRERGSNPKQSEQSVL